MSDFSNFYEIQTKTPWGRTLTDFASFCQPRPSSRILDVGCGPGLLPSIFAASGHVAYGVDVSFSLLSAHLSPNLVQADAGILPFPSATFDLVTATNLLFLLDVPLWVLLEWKRLLRPDGQIALLNPSEYLSVKTAARLADERGLDGTVRASLLDWAHNAEQHVRWTEDQTRALLAQAGFHIVEICLRVGPGFARLVRAITDEFYLH
ncbi:MAG: hypothetical protein Fur0043_24200 [Anaerolineales bacterium]